MSGTVKFRTFSAASSEPGDTAERSPEWAPGVLELPVLSPAWPERPAML